MKQNHIWVVEMLSYHRWVESLSYDRWNTTVGVALTHRDAQKQLREWCGNNPTDKFRVRKYVPIER